MDFSWYMVAVYLIGAASALVMFIPEWRLTGLVVFIASAINILLLDKIMLLVGDHNGLFFLTYDLIVAVILFGFSRGNIIPVIMAGIMCLFCFAHAAYGASVIFQNYTIFWSQYANIILTLNVLQVLFLIWGLGSGVGNIRCVSGNRYSFWNSSGWRGYFVRGNSQRNMEL